MYEKRENTKTLERELSNKVNEIITPVKKEVVNSVRLPLAAETCVTLQLSLLPIREPLNPELLPQSSNGLITLPVLRLILTPTLMSCSCPYTLSAGFVAGGNASHINNLQRLTGN